jgi:ubiquinone/menaquinone biosynthesis C-methylase UbiE
VSPPRPQPARGASVALYNALAPTYDEHFAVAHRKAYDDLAWELVQPLLPSPPGRIVDVGCGIGRWARRLVDMGHVVVGIEPAPAMAARARERLTSTSFELIEQPMEDAELAGQDVDLVLAMGSLQYSEEPEQALRRLALWVRPGGAVAVLVDSLVALVLELLGAGQVDEALARLETRQGTWIQDGMQAEHHLFDSAGLRRAFEAAGLSDIEVRGLLVSWSAFGRDEMLDRLNHDRTRQMALERRLMGNPAVADLAKQLYAWGRVRTALPSRT